MPKTRLENLHDACASGDVRTTRRIIKKTPNLISSKDQDGLSALHVATLNNKHEICKLLIDKNSNLNVIDKQKRTPLHDAAYQGFYEVARLLLANKANPDVQDNYFCTPLHDASFSNNSKIVQELLSCGAKMDIKDKKKFTPYTLALREGNLNVIKIFNNFNSAIINAQDPTGWTALHSATSQNNLPLIQKLCDQKADPNCMTKTGANPLHIALLNKNYKAAELLFNNGAELFDDSKLTHPNKTSAIVKIVLKHSETLSHLPIRQLCEMSAIGFENKVLTNQQIVRIEELIDAKKEVVEDLDIVNYGHSIIDYINELFNDRVIEEIDETDYPKNRANFSDDRDNSDDVVDVGTNDPQNLLGEIS